MSASYPGAVKSFSNRNAGDAIQPSHVNDLQDEVNAIEAGLLNGTAPLNSSNSTVVTLSVTGGKITFPAAQSASTGVNVLDDYEEGTWTPVIGGSGGTTGQTYSNQEGRYIKIGSFVWASCYVALTAKGTITSNLQIQGLPFTCETGTLQYYMSGAVQWGALATTWVSITARVNQNTTTADVLGTGVAATANTSQLATADLTNTSAFLISFMYRAAN